MNGSATGISIVECPRDAMQGIEHFIPAEKKAAYLNLLLQVGFHTLDFGSFVSPKAIPQMRDTGEVLSMLQTGNSKTKLLAIVANLKGAEQACRYDEIDFLGYPFSVSETFQLRNTNSTMAQSLNNVEAIHELCIKHKKQLVIYISMAFGNPYGDPWNEELVFQWVNKIAALGVGIISLADTVGLAVASDIEKILPALTSALPHTEFGVHLHCRPDNWKSKVEAAYQSGCRRFDAAIGGWGGCPMANDELVGNLATENLLQYMNEKNVETGINRIRFNEARTASGMVFNQ